MAKHTSRVLILLILFSVLFTTACSPADQTVTSHETQSDSSVVQSPPTEPAQTSSADEALVFEDDMLYSLICKELGKETLYASDLAPFTSFKLAADQFAFLATSASSEKSIIHFNDNAFEYDGVRYEGFGTVKTLADLKHFPALDRIYISLQPQIDYSTVPKEIARKVRSVLLYQSSIKDISFLKDYENLAVLNLNHHQIKDLSPLMGKDTLLRLSFDWNQVSDLSPLASLTSLKSIHAYGNQISDLSPLAGLPALEELELYGNQIKDLSPLKDIKTLQVLELINNQIEDVSPLSAFESFEALRLNGNPVKNIEVLDHIQALDF